MLQFNPMDSNEGNRVPNGVNDIQNIQLTISQLKILARRQPNQDKEDKGCHIDLVELKELSKSLEDYVLDVHVSVRQIKAHHQALILGAEETISVTAIIDQPIIDPYNQEYSKMNNES